MAVESNGNEEQPINEFEKMDRLIEYILENHQSEVLSKELTREDLIEGAYKGIFDQLDQYSSFYNAEEFKSFEKNTSGEYGGIGAVITLGDESIEIISPLDDSPAQKAGLKAKDTIVEVNGESIRDFSLEAAVNKITGEIGTDVTLKIKRDGKYFDKKLTRGLIEIESVSYEMKEDTIGYMRIKQFQADTTKEVLTALSDLKEKGATELIIDLRNNPGGYLSDVLRVSDLFIDPEKPIMHVDYKNADDKSFYTSMEDLFEGKIAVLINEGSASAAEILASAIKENNEGVLIGQKTFGKGTVQSVKTVDDNAVKLTIAEYLTANKNKINGIGVEPDFIVDDSMVNQVKENLEHLAPMTEDRNIYLEQSSVNVYGLQQRLNILGYDLEEDGIFGLKTLEALNAFQSDYNLEHQKYISPELKESLTKILESEATKEKDSVLEKAITYLLEQ
jgi:carboxyl-terminal processing protease